LEDNEARFLQDVSLKEPGITKLRGNLVKYDPIVVSDRPSVGCASTINPKGLLKFAQVLSFDSNFAGRFRIFSDNLQSAVGYNLGITLGTNPPTNPYPIVDSKPAFKGGSFIGISTSYMAIPQGQQLFLWKGGNSLEYSAGTITLTKGSPIVSGTGTLFLSNVSPGMFLFASIPSSSPEGPFKNTFVGVVKSVDTDTQLTLEAVSPYGGTNIVYSLKAIRGFQYRITKGRITCSTTSPTVTGGQTKFISQFMDEIVAQRNGTTTSGSAVVTGLSQTSDLAVGMRVTGTGIPIDTRILSIDSASQITLTNNATASGTTSLTFKHTWNLYRSSDLAWIGRVVTVNSEISLTLAANAAVSMDNERFVALCGTGDWSYDVLTSARHKPGFLTAVYAGRQWYANRGIDNLNMSRVWFSDTSDPEALDFSDNDGDFINVVSNIDNDTPVKALVPALNGLLVIKDNETFLIGGSSPSTFSVKKIYDDGTPCGMSAVSYGGGVIWAGKQGILFFNGIEVNNLVEKSLGDYYRSMISNFDASRYRMYGMVIRNHYFLFIEQADTTIEIIKDEFIANSLGGIVICINLITGAVSFMTNLSFRGFIDASPDFNIPPLFVTNVWISATLAYQYYPYLMSIFANGDQLFDGAGKDSYVTDGSTQNLHRYGITQYNNEAFTTAAANTKYFSKITVTKPLKIRSVSIYMGGAGGTGTSQVRSGIYSHANGLPDVLLATSNTLTVNATDPVGWVTFTFSPPFVIPYLNGAPIWLGIQVENANIVKFAAQTTAFSIRVDSDLFSDGLANPWGATGSWANGPLVMYITTEISGPSLYIETKRYSFGDPMIRKYFKRMGMTYYSDGSGLTLEMIPGLQVGAYTVSTEFPAVSYKWDDLTALFTSWDSVKSTFPTWDSFLSFISKAKTANIFRRGTLLGFRIWNTVPDIKDAKIGILQIFYKVLRLGRY
ncbi:MAG: hypothetical protein QW303_02020, partial [Nitrososphaerota archaeon]